jgi:hypothetical protein
MSSRRRRQGPFPLSDPNQPHTVVLLSSGEPVQVIGPFPVESAARRWGRTEVAEGWAWFCVPIIAPEQYRPPAQQN